MEVAEVVQVLPPGLCWLWRQVGPHPESFSASEALSSRGNPRLAGPGRRRSTDCESTSVWVTPSPPLTTPATQLLVPKNPVPPPASRGAGGPVSCVPLEPVPPSLSGEGAWACLIKDQRGSATAPPPRVVVALGLPQPERPAPSSFSSPSFDPPGLFPGPPPTLPHPYRHPQNPTSLLVSQLS